MGWIFEEILIKASPGSLGLRVSTDCNVSRIMDDMNMNDDIPACPPDGGFKVLSVEPTSQSHGKIEVDDIITHIDGKRMMDMKEFVNVLVEKKDAHKILTVHRVTFKFDQEDDDDIKMNINADLAELQAKEHADVLKRQAEMYQKAQLAGGGAAKSQSQSKPLPQSQSQIPPNASISLFQISEDDPIQVSEGAAGSKRKLVDGIDQLTDVSPQAGTKSKSTDAKNSNNTDADVNVNNAQKNVSSGEEGGSDGRNGNDSGKGTAEEGEGTNNSKSNTDEGGEGERGGTDANSSSNQSDDDNNDNHNNDDDDDNEHEHEHSDKENMTEKQQLRMRRRASLNDPRARCDVCQERDGYRGMNLQQCSDCNVYVHETCYGLENYKPGTKFMKWKCHACAVVGREIVVSKKREELKKITIQSRPKRCALCPVTTGMHAMHPLYDRHGKGGRPVVYKHELLWVHTLCAFVINSNRNSKGLVYGCHARGEYDQEEDDEDEDEEQQSDNDDDDNNDGDDEGIILDLDHRKRSDSSLLLVADVHHFVIAYNDITLVSRVEEFRELKCHVCRHDDQRVRRIPIQCSHKSCQTAFHVGCARWGVPEKERRIRFYPGDDEKDAFAAGYCKTHSKLSRRLHTKELEEKEEEEDEEEEEDSSVEDTDDDDDDDDEMVTNVDEEDLFDDDVDRPKPQSREVFVKQKKAKRYKVGELLAGRSKDSAYFKKKRDIEDMSERILRDYKKELEDGEPFEKVKKRVDRHWKQSPYTTQSMLRIIYERIELDLKELEDLYTKKQPGSSSVSASARGPDADADVDPDSDSGELDPEAEAEERRKAAAQMGQWVDLFEPNCKRVITHEWDTYEVVSESELSESEWDQTQFK